MQEDMLPIAVRPEKVSSDTKKLIFELEEEYIKRYNILNKNRAIFASII